MTRGKGRWRFNATGPIRVSCGEPRFGLAADVDAARESAASEAEDVECVLAAAV